MDRTAWEALLRQWSQEVLSSEHADSLPPEVISSGWLGFPGAREEEIQEAEARLKTKLPPSYRAFLKVSNGWRITSPFIERLWSTSEVAWLKERHPDWALAWKAGEQMYGHPPVSDAEYFNYGPDQAEYNLRVEYLETALEISDVGDAAIYLLNPKVVTADGEWEAWFFANWLPGARRYRSFQELMLAEFETFKTLR
ncbi:SMI1/KNR4 family protein [Microvirga arabica]|uniref:SMI1/KNR4 family protein n=1 Tax=Microvirga arabica TaxID=1128671 RepID=UPI00193A8F4E|nr:SMI1/KNR4 family protein [Microvirga arabica]MBM1172055.1 SMI1/KNR4 family protein [Microvirga arabica]